MTPEISEFSYGFALTNEMVGWAPLSVAPVFPNLIEEGREGGGYDVKLDLPGIPFFLQFKRADCMTRKNATEIRDHNLPLSLPFYRFKITESGKSNQHRLLLALDDGVNAVFYAAPRFHEFNEINQAWNHNEVASRSIFVAPSDIGELDWESHHVTYDRANTFLCSEPRRIKSFSSSNLLEICKSKLTSDPRPLKTKISEIKASVDAAIDSAIRAERKASLDETRSIKSQDDFSSKNMATFKLERGLMKPLEKSDQFLPSIEPVPTKPARTLKPHEQDLRDISNLAAKVFDVQIMIIQPNR